MNSNQDNSQGSQNDNSQTSGMEEVSQTLQNFEGGGEQQTESQQSGEQQTEQKVDKGLLSDADVSKLTEAFRAANPGSQQQSPSTTQQRQYTQEEINKLLNVFEPDDALIAELSDPATFKQGMAKLVSGMRKEYNTLLQVQMKTFKGEVDNEYKGVRTFAQEQAAKTATTEFFSANKDLNFPQGQEVANMVTNQLHSAGHLQGKNKADASKIIADQTRAMLKRLGVSAPADAGGQQTQQNNAPRRPAALSSGSNGGSQQSNSPATGGVSADLKELFGS